MASGRFVKSRPLVVCRVLRVIDEPFADGLLSVI